jgi:hypothetical protein
VERPSFFRCIFKYSILMLTPIFVIVTLVFLQGGGEFSAPRKH